MKILITGSKGFVGTHLSRSLSKKHKIVGFDVKDGKDIFDTKLLNSNLKNVEVVIHLAAYVSGNESWEKPLDYFMNNGIGTFKVIDAAIRNKVKRIIFFSSAAVYGKPLTPYGASKVFEEAIATSYKDRIETVVLRPFNIYGPGMKPNDYRVIPTFVSKALSGEPLPVHDKGSQTRTFCYVTDAVSGFLKILLSEKNGEVYNIGNEKPEITVYDLALAIAKVSPKKVAIKKIEYPASYPAGEPQRRCPDLTKSRTMLDYNPKVDLDTGLRRSIDWFISEYKL